MEAFLYSSSTTLEGDMTIILDEIFYRSY